MDKLGCLHLADKDFGELSQGQKQMVILARCIAQNAPVMLMDEPDSALDFLNKHIVLEKIRTVVRDGNKKNRYTDTYEDRFERKNKRKSVHDLWEN